MHHSLRPWTYISRVRAPREGKKLTRERASIALDLTGSRLANHWDDALRDEGAQRQSPTWRAAACSRLREGRTGR